MPSIGIDLGTSYSCVATFKDGQVEIIPNEEGNFITPSYVAFTKKGRFIGDAAKGQAALNPENTIFDAKRLIGRKYNDKQTQEDIKLWPFTVKEVNGNPKIVVKVKNEEEKIFAPEEISAMVLAKMKEVAETYLETSVCDAVITVPAYFKDSQRHATRDAATIAGLNVLRIISEPNAAALAYGLEKNFTGERNVLVYDLGGGTFDVSIMTITEEGSKFEVKATTGETHLGGEDFDNRLVQYFLENIKQKHKIDYSENERAKGRLRKHAETVKRELASATETYCTIPNFLAGSDFRLKVTRIKFEKLCLDLFERTLVSVEKALRDAKMDKSKIDDIVLVGGSSRIPKIQSILQKFFKGKQLTMNINVEEAVAYGAAVQAAILSEEEDDHLPVLFVQDITPLALGVEVEGGIMSAIIPRNTPIPIKKKKTYTTTLNNQPIVSFPVYEGERELTKDNKLLGSFKLTGITPALAGKPCLVVTFEVDINGILNVTAEEVGTNSTKKIVMKNDTGRLSKEEIDRMIIDAERFKEEDSREKNRISSRQHLETYAFNVVDLIINSSVRDEYDKITTRCEEVLEWLVDHNSEDRKIYEDIYKDLYRVCQPIVTGIANFHENEALYQAREVI